MHTHSVSFIFRWPNSKNTLIIGMNRYFLLPHPSSGPIHIHYPFLFRSDLSLFLFSEKEYGPSPVRRDRSWTHHLLPPTSRSHPKISSALYFHSRLSNQACAVHLSSIQLGIRLSSFSVHAEIQKMEYKSLGFSLLSFHLHYADPLLQPWTTPSHRSIIYSLHASNHRDTRDNDWIIRISWIYPPSLPILSWRLTKKRDSCLCCKYDHLSYLLLFQRG